MSHSEHELWYKDGLRFSCVEGCARCCGGAPGDVFVTRTEMEALAAAKGETVPEFESHYIRHYIDGRLSIKERRNGDCLLLKEDGKGCSVYNARPAQCRSYPFWPELLAKPGAWARESRRCPGLNSGELHSAPRITEILRGSTG